MIEQKRCGHCREVKPVAAFGRHRSNPDGLQCWCFDCRHKDYLKRREKDGERARHRKAESPALVVRSNNNRTEGEQKAIEAKVRDWLREMDEKGVDEIEIPGLFGSTSTVTRSMATNVLTMWSESILRREAA